MLAIVERDMHRAFSAGKQQPTTSRIFAHNVGIFVLWNPVRDFRPGSATVTCAINVRAQVIQSQRVDGRIGGLLIKVARFNNRYFVEWLELRRGDVFPVSASVSGYMNQTVIGAGPDQIDVQW